MLEINNDKKIVKEEVRYAIHIPRSEYNEDTHYVKYQVTYEDGTRKPVIRNLVNVERPAYVTRENMRNHREKREFELKENLLMKMTTDSDLHKTYANMLGEDFLATRPRLLAESPYVYALNIKASNLIKLASLVKNEFFQTPYTVATFDVETSTGSNKDPISAALSMRRDGIFVLHVYVWSGWYGSPSNFKKATIENYAKRLDAEFYIKGASNSTPYEKVRFTNEKELREYIGKKHWSVDPNTHQALDDGVVFTGKEPDVFERSFWFKKEVIEVIPHLFDDQVDMIKALFRQANEWAPDWLTAWNIDFDLGDSILPMLKKRGVRYTDVFCDQRLPQNLRKFTYRRGKAKKVTSSGKETPVSPADRWHEIECTSTFYFIDQMCVYRRHRVHKGQEPSYGLDAILHKEGIGLKLRFTEVGSTGPSWHNEMQTYHKEDYIVYMGIDVIRPLQLEEKTGDLSGDAPTQAEIVDFKNYDSSERKNYASFFIYGLKKGRIIGTATNKENFYKKLYEEAIKEERREYGQKNYLLPDVPAETYKSKVYGLRGWIQTLPQGNFVRDGLKIFSDFPELITNVRGNVVDLDSVSSYPSCIIASNVSLETTHTEIISIEGMNESTSRMYNLGVVIPNTNSLEYCSAMFNLPNLQEIDRMIENGEL